ncbi:hypothetical protein PG991_001264 [Apiospora marii]|uniref:Uncharacterized protein n=1 Tax=Apiospora marii TaxID=335849 RepID=A0ABR1STB1_9PEZI
MLEAPFAIVALCAPTIGQLGVSAFKDGRFTSRLSSLFRSSKRSQDSRETQETHASKEAPRSSRFGSSTSDTTSAPRRSYVPLESKQPFKTTSITQKVSSNPNQDANGYLRSSVHIGRTDRGSEEDTIPMAAMHRYDWGN